MNGNITKKLAAVQKELKAPKNQRNDFGKYNYRSCEDILEAAKPLLAKNDLTLTISDTITAVGDRIYVKATATIYSGEEEISVSAFAREEESKKGMDASQVTGAASSYARKYALNGLFCIDDTKDSDATNDHGKAEKPEPEKKEEPKAPAKVPKPAAKEEKTDEPVLTCENCKNMIKPFIDSKGRTVTPTAIARKSMDKFGKVLCVDCAAEAANAS